MTPPPGWQRKLDRALAVWLRHQSATHGPGVALAAAAYRILQALLSQRP